VFDREDHLKHMHKVCVYGSVNIEAFDKRKETCVALPVLDYLSIATRLLPQRNIAQCIVLYNRHYLYM
jgi:hypothetical protein